LSDLTLADSGKARQAARGFTLLEMMLVMVILGLLAVTVSLALPDSARQRLDTDALRLKAQIALAMEQGIYRNRDYGLWVGDHAYRFFARDGENWLPQGRESRLEPYSLDADTRLRLSVWGEPVGPDAAHPEPQILFLSDGQVSGFELRLSHASVPTYRLISASFAGDLRLLESEQP
jgi:general secretion pathway protein H